MSDVSWTPTIPEAEVREGEPRVVMVGQKEVVLQYFDLCAKFWKSDQQQPDGGRLAKWRAQVEKGEMPDFGPNLRR